MRLVLASAVFLCSCDFQGDMLVNVAFERPAPGPDCVALTALDLATAVSETPRTETAAVPLASRPASGSLKFGVQQPQGWLACVRLTAALRAGGCEGEVVATSEKIESCFERNVAKTFDLKVRWMGEPSDGGLDGGSGDAGANDAGDAGPMDAGSDGGLSELDAGGDAGPPYDAGYNIDGGPFCTADLRVLSTGGGNQWKDLVIYNLAVRQIMAVGDGNALALISNNGMRTDWSGGSCTGNFRAAWMSPSTGLAYAATTTRVYAIRWGAPAAGCETVASFANTDVSSLAGLDLPDGGVQLFVGAQSAPYLFRTLPDAGTQPELIVVPGPVNDLVVFDSITMWAAGSETNHVSTWRHNATTDRWDSFATSTPGAFFSIALASPSQVFVVGADGTAVKTAAWDGAAWLTTPTPDFKPFGVAMRDRNNVTVVGQKRPGMAAGFARWDGTSWSYPAGASSNADHLRRVRTAGGCEVWAVGDNGYVVTTTSP